MKKYQNIPELNIIAKQTNFKLHPSQEKTALLLHQRFGAYYKDVFVDICRMMSCGGDYNSQRYLAGHLISELESALRQILMPITGAASHADAVLDDDLGNKKEKILSALKDAGYPDPEGCSKVDKVIKNLKQPDTHKGQIARIVDGLGFKEDQSIGFWLEVSGRFHGFRHMPRKGSPKKVDDDFAGVWEDFQKLLRFIVASVDKKYTAFLDVVSEIKDAPSSQNLKRLQALPPNVLTQKSFFEGNNNSGWLSLLDGAGYFNSPPPSEEKLDDEKAVNAFHWPAAEYLTCMASSGDIGVQGKVLEIVQKIPKTDNVWVNRELVNIAKVLLVEQSVQLYSKIEESIEALKGSIFLRDVADVIKFWAKNQQGEKALNLTKSLLSLEKGEGDPEEKSKFREDYEFKQAIKTIKQPLAKSAPLEALTYFCDLLDAALKDQYKDGKDDYLYISLPDVGRDNEGSRGIANGLVMAIGDTAALAISEKLLSFEQIEEVLNRYKWDVFERLKLFIASEFPEKAPETVSLMLLSGENQEKHSREKEYKRLALKGYAYLSDEAKAAMIKRLEDGPQDIEERLRVYSERTGKETTEEDVKKYKEIWLRDELKGWVEALPNEWQERYAAITDKFGEGFDSGVRIMRGPGSPKDVEELKELELDELVVYLRDWRPSEDTFTGPSMEGLRQELKKVVRDDVNYILADIEKFFVLQPTYIQGILSTLSEIVRNKGQINWEKAFVLCEWVLSQKNEDIEKTPEAWEADNTWKWVCLDIGNLIEAGFQYPSEQEIPLEFRERIWAIIDNLRHYKECDREQPQEDDLYQQAGVTIPGQALECVIKYGLWVRRHQKKQGAKITGFSTGLEEVHDALNQHLNAVEQPVLRSVYGRYFPWLHLMDQSWAETNITNIFRAPLIMDGAWRAFIMYSGGPYKDGFNTIKPLYEKAVTELSVTPRIEDENYYQLLGDRVMVFMMWGEEKINGDLISAYFNHATDEDRAHSIWFASRTLAQKELEAEIAEDMKKFADARLTFISQESDTEGYQKELKRYGMWFGSEHLDLDWQITFLEKLISMASKIDGDDEIFKFLEMAFPIHTKRVMACLEEVLFNLNMDYWEIQHSREHISKILLDALNHEDSDIQNKAEDIRNQLVANNHATYQDLRMVAA